MRAGGRIPLISFLLPTLRCKLSGSCESIRQDVDWVARRTSAGMGHCYVVPSLAAADVRRLTAVHLGQVTFCRPLPTYDVSPPAPKRRRPATFYRRRLPTSSVPPSSLLTTCYDATKTPARAIVVTERLNVARADVQFAERCCVANDNVFAAPRSLEIVCWCRQPPSSTNPLTPLVVVKDIIDARDRRRRGHHWRRYAIHPSNLPGRHLLFYM